MICRGLAGDLARGLNYFKTTGFIVILSLWIYFPGRLPGGCREVKQIGKYIQQINNNMQNKFGTFYEGSSRHQIMMANFHSLFGTPQPILFVQTGPITWRGKHRNGCDQVELHLIQPQFDSLPYHPLTHSPPACQTPDVIALPLTTLPFSPVIDPWSQWQWSRWLDEDFTVV